MIIIIGKRGAERLMKIDMEVLPELLAELVKDESVNYVLDGETGEVIA